MAPAETFAALGGQRHVCNTFSAGWRCCFMRNSRHHSQQPSRWLLVPILFTLSSGTSDGVDMSQWARHQRVHRDWTSVDFRDPDTGLFLAARAGTEDKHAGVTLTLTSTPVQGCAPDTVLIRKTVSPVASNRDEIAQVTARFDSMPARQLSSRYVTQIGDWFVFVQLIDELPVAALRNYQVLAVTLPDGHPARFSLVGFDHAWAEAESVCRAFVTP